MNAPNRIGVSGLILPLSLEEFQDALDTAVAKALESKAEAPTRRLYDRRGIGEVLGVGVDTVDKLRKLGMPVVMVADAPRFDADECVSWCRSRTSATAGDV